MTQPKFLLGSGEVVTPDTAEDSAKLRQLGVAEATPQDIKRDNLRQQYSSWLFAPEAAALGIANMVLPGATGAAVEALSAISPEMGATTADFIEGVSAAHPVAKGIGTVAGALTPGGVLGTAGGLAKTTIQGAVMGAGMALDDAALEHVRSPEGAEKVLASMGMGALLGGALNVGAAGLFKWVGAGGIGKAGAKLEQKGAEGLMTKSPLGNPGIQARLEETGASETVAELAQKYELLDKTPKQVRNKLSDILDSATKAMNEAKAVSSEALPAQDGVAFAQQLGKQLSGAESGLQKLVQRTTKSPPTVGDLHQLRIGIDKRINWKDPTSAYSQKLIRARELVDDFLKKVLDHNATAHPEVAGDQVGRWIAANEDYAAAKALQDALRHSEATGKSFLGKVGQRVSSAGASGAIFSTLGGNLPLAAAGAGAFVGGKAIEGLAEKSFVAPTVQGLGKFLQTFDDKVVQTLADKLEGAATSKAGPAVAELANIRDYATLAAGIQWTAENPTVSIPKMAERLEGAGVPGQVVDAAVPQTIKAAQYLKSVSPKNPWVGATVAPTAWQPTTGQKAEFIDKVNAVNNPLWALQNPTPARMEAVRAVYPIMAQRYALMAAQEAAQRPQMALAARKWAAAVTGQAATPLSNPQARATLQMVDDMQKAQPQMGGQRSGRGGNILIPQTRLNRLSE